MSTRLLKTLHTTILTLTLGVSMNANAGLFGRHHRICQHLVIWNQQQQACVHRRCGVWRASLLRTRKGTTAIRQVHTTRQCRSQQTGKKTKKPKTD